MWWTNACQLRLENSRSNSEWWNRLRRKSHRKSLMLWVSSKNTWTYDVVAHKIDQWKQTQKHQYQRELWTKWIYLDKLWYMRVTNVSLVVVSIELLNACLLKLTKSRFWWDVFERDYAQKLDVFRSRWRKFTRKRRRCDWCDRFDA